MSFYTVLKGRDVAAGAVRDDPERFIIVSEAIEAESPQEALDMVVGDPYGGEGHYMIVEVKGLFRVLAKTEYSIDPITVDELTAPA